MFPSDLNSFKILYRKVNCSVFFCNIFEREHYVRRWLDASPDVQRWVRLSAVVRERCTHRWIESVSKPTCRDAALCPRFERDRSGQLRFVHVEKFYTRRFYWFAVLYNVGWQARGGLVFIVDAVLARCVLPDSGNSRC